MQLVTRTLYCIGGYLIGFLVPLVIICARYGVMAYPRMISSLFGMTDHATDYKPTSMVMAMFGDYIRYSAWLLIFVGYMALGVLFFYFLERLVKKSKKKIAYVFELLYGLGLLVVLRFCYGRGMFDFNYSRPFSMYKWVTVYLLIVVLLCIWLLFYKTADRNLKLWAVFFLVIIFVTPLGSNNRLHPIINNLFLVIPVSMLMIIEIFNRCHKTEQAKLKSFAFRLVLGFILICTAIQSVMFGIGFVFHDENAQVASDRNNRHIELQCDSAGAGLVTTVDKKEALEELDQYLYQNGLNKKQVILYGDIPSISYLLDMKPAIFTTWADLDSNSINLLEADLGRLTDQDASDALPVIILGRSSVEMLTQEDGIKYQKLKLIMDFAEESGYRQCFGNDAFIVFNVY